MKNKPQKPAPTFTSKLHSRSGHTLVELLVVLVLISFFGMIAVTVISYAAITTDFLITRARFLTVSDTISEALRGILRYSTYICTENETVYFLNESYCGWESSLEASEGFIFMSFYDGSKNCREKLLPDPSYAGFSAEDFELKYEDGEYNVRYRLTKGRYCEDFEFRVTPISD